MMGSDYYFKFWVLKLRLRLFVTGGTVEFILNIMQEG